jgi:hypothetical protein
MSDPDADYQPSPSDAILSSPGHIVPAREPVSLAEGTKPPVGVKLPVPDGLVLWAESSVRLVEHNFVDGLARYGYTAVIDLAFHCSSDVGHKFHSNAHFRDLLLWRTRGTCLLGDIPLRLLQSLLDGTLMNKVAKEDRELHPYFFNPGSDWVKRKGGDEFAPVHYVRIFGDKDGKSLSPNQLRPVLRDLKRYASGKPKHDETCAEIDNMTRKSHVDAADIRAGLHHFFKRSDARPQVLLTFIQALTQYLDTVDPEKHDEPLPHPFQYVGFASNANRRAAEHDYESSSWLSTLFESVCKRLFTRPEGGPVFKFEMFVVAFPINRDECKLGEELFARMCKSYHYSGLGFNIQPAGVTSVDLHLQRLAEADVHAAWQERSAWRNKNPKFSRQVYHDTEHLMPEWEKMLKYRLEPDAHRQRQVDRVSAQVAKILAPGPSEAQVRAQVYAMEHRDHEEGEEEEVDELVRDALASVHRRAERMLLSELDELDLDHAMSTASD